MPTFPAYINPLGFNEIDDFFRDKERQPTAGDVLAAAVLPEAIRFVPPEEREAFIVAKFQERAIELESFGHVVGVPIDEFSFDKLAWPLRAAKMNYAFGNFAAVIGLAGMVCEMVTIAYFDGGAPFDGAPLAPEKAERISQEKRIDGLVASGVLTATQGEALHDVRKSRNAYLHRITQTHEAIEADAKRVFGHALHAFLELTHKGFNEGKFVFGPQFEAGLVKRGVIKPDPQP